MADASSNADRGLVTPRWKNRPVGSDWGDFGPGDPPGRSALLTPTKLPQGVAEGREGLRLCLGLPLDFPGRKVPDPRRLPPVLRPGPRSGRPKLDCLISRDDADRADVVADDLVVFVGCPPFHCRRPK